MRFSATDLLYRFVPGVSAGFRIILPFLASVRDEDQLRSFGQGFWKKKKSNKTFGKVNLDYLVQSSSDNAEDEEELDAEVKIFQNALDFSSIKIRDCIVPRTEIVAVEMNANLKDVKRI